jgi:hypothetical protein
MSGTSRVASSEHFAARGVPPIEGSRHETDISQLVRRCFDAHLTRDRAALEAVIGDPFSFTSPYDDHIDRKTYFERCWGNAERIKAHRVEKLFAQGDEAFALYEASWFPVKNSGTPNSSASKTARSQQ